MRAKKPYIMMIDDDEFFLNDAEIELRGKATFKGFKGPNDFEREVKQEDITAADLIVVDYEFRGGSATKSKIAEYIREDLGYRGKMVLCSLHADNDFFGERDNLARSYDAIIHKRDLTWGKLNELRQA